MCFRDITKRIFTGGFIVEIFFQLFLKFTSNQ